MHVLSNLPALLLLFGAACASNSAVNEEPQAPAFTPEMEAEMMALGQPGPEHKVLEHFAGEWDVTVRVWMAPDTPPVVSAAHTTSELVLGGRFLQSHTRGEMEIMGQTISSESIGMLGFDRRNEVFTTIGFDTTGTYYVAASGTLDDSGKKISMAGSDHDSKLNFTQEYRFEVSLVEDDHYTVDVIFTSPAMTHGLDEFRVVQLSYARAR